MLPWLQLKLVTDMFMFHSVESVAINFDYLYKFCLCESVCFKFVDSNQLHSHFLECNNPKINFVDSSQISQI